MNTERDQSKKEEGASLLFGLAQSTETNAVRTAISVAPDRLGQKRFSTYHPVCSESSLDEACEDVGGVVAVVRDASQASVDGYHH